MMGLKSFDNLIVNSCDRTNFDVPAAHHTVPAASAGTLLGHAADSVIIRGALREIPHIHINKHTDTHILSEKPK